MAGDLKQSLFCPNWECHFYQEIQRPSEGNWPITNCKFSHSRWLNEHFQLLQGAIVQTVACYEEGHSIPQNIWEHILNLHNKLNPSLFPKRKNLTVKFKICDQMKWHWRIILCQMSYKKKNCVECCWMLKCLTRILQRTLMAFFS